MFLQLSGFKKVLNYTKKVTEEIRYRTALSREEVMFECLEDFLLFIILICTRKNAMRCYSDGSQHGYISYLACETMFTT